MCKQSHDSISKTMHSLPGNNMPRKHIGLYATISYKKQLKHNIQNFETKQLTNNLSIYTYLLLMAPNFDYVGFLETVEEIICNNIYLCQMHLISFRYILSTCK